MDLWTQWHGQRRVIGFWAPKLFFGRVAPAMECARSADLLRNPPGIFAASPVTSAVAMQLL